MTAPTVAWQFKGDYFENCNCDVTCPCLFSAGPQMSAMPTQGVCDVLLAFHLDEGTFGDTTLDGFNAVVTAHTPGAMGDGNWELALYLDERANEAQRAGLQAIFSGAAGGVMGALAPLVSKVHGVKPTRIDYHKDGEIRSVEMPGIASMSVEPIDTRARGAVAWVTNSSPFAPDSVALARGRSGSTYIDYGFSWDNSGKNGHFAPINWSNG